MLVTINPNVTLWEALLPAECLEMAAESWWRWTGWDDPVFFEPYRKFFDRFVSARTRPKQTVR